MTVIVQLEPPVVVTLAVAVEPRRTGELTVNATLCATGAGVGAIVEAGVGATVGIGVGATVGATGGGAGGAGVGDAAGATVGAPVGAAGAATVVRAVVTGAAVGAAAAATGGDALVGAPLATSWATPGCAEPAHAITSAIATTNTGRTHPLVYDTPFAIRTVPRAPRRPPTLTVPRPFRALTDAPLFERFRRRFLPTLTVFRKRRGT